jgi:hypothetical protein
MTEATAAAVAAAAAAAANQDNEHIPMVVDLGSHILDGLGNALLPGNPALTLQVSWRDPGTPVGFRAGFSHQVGGWRFPGGCSGY